MRLNLLLTVQPPEGGMRHFSCRREADRAPQVGDRVAVARHANSSPDSSGMDAVVTAITWTDLTFEQVNVFLSSLDDRVSMETLTDPTGWVDEEDPYPTAGSASGYSYKLSVAEATDSSAQDEDTTEPDHGWTEGFYLTTVTCVRRASLRDVLGVLDIRSVPEQMRLEDLDPSPVRNNSRWESPVQLEALAGWVVVMEPDVNRCLDAGVRAGLLRLGAVVTVYKSINADAQFFFGHDGVERRFDPVGWPNGSQVGQPLDEEAGLVFGAETPANPYEQSIRLMKRLTGIDFTTSWVVNTPRATYLGPTFY